MKDHSTILDKDNADFINAEQLIRQTDHSVFLTGKAGTGKSTFLRYIAETIQKRHIVVAPTGVAAINARGVTIHSFFQIPLGLLMPHDERIREVKFRKKKRDIIKNLELLIIDEISMVRADVMDAIDQVLRITRKNFKPFGGVQLLLVGDLFQLEPVVKNEDRELLGNHYDAPFFFNALVFERLDLFNLELTRIYRQSDERFIDLLNKIRNKTIESYDLEDLNERCQPPIDPEELLYVTLTATRKAADTTNSQKLAAINQTEMTYTGVVSGEFPKNNLPTELDLKLKEGAQVIFVKNDSGENRRWVNGTVGVIEELFEDKIYVRLENGEVIKVAKTLWDNIRYEYDEKDKKIKDIVVGTFKQYPVKLAWAITIHKSQGLTFDHVIIDLGRGAFASGQLYVALSRCTTFYGLFLKQHVRYSDVIVREEIVRFYEKMNDLSDIRKALELE